MPKERVNYECSNCGHISPKWLGKCPSCSSWNSFTQIKQLTDAQQILEKKNISRKFNRVETIEQILDNLDEEKTFIYPFSVDTLNAFWGGGIKSGSLSLLAGEPGLGKSTFALQLLRSLNQSNKQLNYLYITAEESVRELAQRGQRLDISGTINLMQCNCYEDIEKEIETNTYNLVIIDSIQTLYSRNTSSAPGSVTQVTLMTNQFLALSKSKNIAIILIGHVTKDGQIAGPRTLEHMVDSVLMIEKSESSQYRTITFIKHRFGTTDNLLLLKMEEKGLNIVRDTTLALLENLETGVGVSYSVSMDKNFPFIIEIQALVSDLNENSKLYGKREVIGMKLAKLNVILAIAEKYLDLDLQSRDVYLQITGSLKGLNDESVDLAILLAILSSYLNKPLNYIFNDHIKGNNSSVKLIFNGRLTLSGNLRNSTDWQLRQKTAKNLGFQFNPSIENGEIKNLFKLIISKIKK
jgi:DNA repair protein RadA/Sms